MKPRTKKGFTLIELLVVISIIALLVSILLPALNEARNRARLLKCLVNCRSVGTAMSAYANDYDDEAPVHFALPEGAPVVKGQRTSGYLGQNFYAWYLARCMRAGNQNFLQGQIMGNPPKYFGPYCLYATGVIDNFTIFYCPGQVNIGDEASTFDPEYYTDPITRKWVTAGQAGHEDGQMADQIRISYMYAKPMVNRKNPYKLAKFSQNALYFDTIHGWDTLSHKASNGEAKGINVLYGDGHAITDNRMELFDEDILINNCNEDPWQRAVLESGGNYNAACPGNVGTRFLKLYLIIQNTDPLAYTVTQGDYEYTMSVDWPSHLWK